jgi:hypothetical protein
MNFLIVFLVGLFAFLGFSLSGWLIQLSWNGGLFLTGLVPQEIDFWTGFNLAVLITVVGSCFFTVTALNKRLGTK